MEIFEQVNYPFVARALKMVQTADIRFTGLSAPQRAGTFPGN